MTHLYNAMPGISHREPGPIIAALEAGAEAELITDGIHIHPAVVRATFRLFGDDRVILISDSMMAAGLPDGSYSLGGQDVTVRGPKAVLTQSPGNYRGECDESYGLYEDSGAGNGNSSGKCCKSEQCEPARSIGIQKDYGSLEEGRLANILLLDEKLKIVHMIHKGRKIY